MFKHKDYLEAKTLWKLGWCWRAVGKKYNTSGYTIKNHLKSITDQDRNKHGKLHAFSCPLCVKNDAQVSLL